MKDTVYSDLLRIRLDAHLKLRLSEECEALGLSKSDLVRFLIDVYLYWRECDDTSDDVMELLQKKIVYC